MMIGRPTRRPLASVGTLPRCKSAIAIALIALFAGCGSESVDLTGTVAPPNERPALASTYRPSGREAAGDVFVHLFEWRWSDISTECTSRLGPAGYRAVQVSPPQEHALVNGSPWWQRYQPVSYKLDRSRSGTGAEFAAMVQTCRAANVNIYVDAVINHMTAGSGTGSAGTVYTKTSYPPLFSAADFHPACGVSNYADPVNVQDCELLGLADLRTSVPSVQRKIADYLIALSRLGVAGFRIDAAKHMQPSELDAIVALVNTTATAESRAQPYWYGEVIDYGNEGVRATDYFGLGYRSGGAADISEFKYRGIGDKFMNAGNQRVADLAQFSVGEWRVMPSDKAVSFIENHDTQRDGNPISYRDGDILRLAYVWLLAYPYGYPMVMSSYAFDRQSQGGRDRGPPSSSTGETRAVQCTSSWQTAAADVDWICEHRDPVLVRTVGFRKRMAGRDVSRVWTNGSNAVAFSRGTNGFVVINREDVQLTASIPTSLAAGTYCDVLTGGATSGACAGLSVVVAVGGTASVVVPARRAIVLEAGEQR